jgi:hypothetical protein
MRRQLIGCGPTLGILAFALLVVACLAARA